jgi:hypothetical protein
MKLLVACTRPRGETSRKAAQRQEFAARQLGVLAGPDGDPAARAAMGPAGAVPALLALLERGTDKGAGSLHFVILRLGALRLGLAFHHVQSFHLVPAGSPSEPLLISKLMPAQSVGR